MTERETINRRILEWLHGVEICEHADISESGICGKCSAPAYPEVQIPDYHSWDGMRLLLEGIREKDEDYRIRIKSWSDDWSVDIESFGETLAEAEAVTLPDAVCKAALGLIESNAATQPSDDSPNDQHEPLSGGTNNV